MLLAVAAIGFRSGCVIIGRQAAAKKKTGASVSMSERSSKRDALAFDQVTMQPLALAAAMVDQVGRMRAGTDRAASREDSIGSAGGRREEQRVQLAWQEPGHVCGSSTLRQIGADIFGHVPPLRLR